MLITHFTLQSNKTEWHKIYHQFSVVEQNIKNKMIQTQKYMKLTRRKESNMYFKVIIKKSCQTLYDIPIVPNYINIYIAYKKIVILHLF